MKELIRKELLVNRSSFMVSFMLPIPLYLIASIPNNNKIQLYMIFSSVILMATIFIILLIVGDKDHKMNDLFSSLPIERKYIIKSKYLIHSFFPLIFSTLLYIFISIIKWEVLSYQREVIDYDVVVISTSISLILSAILIPVLLNWRKTIFMLNFLIIVINAGIHSVRFHRHLDLEINYGLLSILLAIIAIIVYLISLKISTRILKKRWLKE